MTDTDKDVALRRAAKYHLLANPNYFGNLVELDLPDLPKPVLKKVGDTGYEELGCLGYNPDTAILTAIVGSSGSRAIGAVPAPTDRWSICASISTTATGSGSITASAASPSTTSPSRIRSATRCRS